MQESPEFSLAIPPSLVNATFDSHQQHPLVPGPRGALDTVKWRTRKACVREGRKIFSQKFEIQQLIFFKKIHLVTKVRIFFMNRMWDQSTHVYPGDASHPRLRCLAESVTTKPRLRVQFSPLHSSFFCLFELLKLEPFPLKKYGGSFCCIRYKTCVTSKPWYILISNFFFFDVVRLWSSFFYFKIDLNCLCFLKRKFRLPALICFPPFKYRHFFVRIGFLCPPFLTLSYITIC